VFDEKVGDAIVKTCPILGKRSATISLESVFGGESNQVKQVIANVTARWGVAGNGGFITGGKPIGCGSGIPLAIMATSGDSMDFETSLAILEVSDDLKVEFCNEDSEASVHLIVDVIGYVPVDD
jgi:hypothetical protein